MKAYFTLIPVCMAAFLSAPAHAEYCREFTKSVYVGGRMQQAYGTSCMQPDGAWKIVQQPVMQSAPIIQASPVTYVQPVRYVEPVTYYSGYSRPYYPTASFFSFSYNSGHHWDRHRHRNHYYHGNGWGHRHHHHW